MLAELRDELVLRAGLGLEAEDRLILGAGQVRGEHGGILRLVNERYYQFIVWRSVLPKWPSAVEIDYHDLIIDNGSSRTPLAIVEMKNWVSGSGNKEIPGIKNDVAKLRDAQAQNCGLMLFSVNPIDATDSNVAALEKLVFTDAAIPRRSMYRFQTIDARGRKVEFWVSLWGVEKPVI